MKVQLVAQKVRSVVAWTPYVASVCSVVLFVYVMVKS